MSRLADLGDKFSNLPTLIVEFEEAFEGIEENLRLSGKALDKALNEQSTWPIFYAQRRAELKTIMKYLDAQVSAARGRLARRYVENYSRTLGERVMNSFIDSEDEYLKINELYLEIAELHDKFDDAVSAFDKRGFALRDLTAARIATIQNATL
jgi:hypothetical protein